MTFVDGEIGWVRAMISAILLLILVVFGTVAAQDLAIELRDALTPQGCDSACFLGITPGVTTPDEAESILQSEGINFDAIPLQTFRDPGEEITYYLLTFSPTDAPNELFPYDFGFVRVIISSETINEIIMEGVVNLSVADVVQAFGPPDDLVFTTAGYALDYDSRRLRFYIDPDDPDLNISWLIIMSEEVKNFLDSDAFNDENLQPCIEPSMLCSLQLATPVVTEEPTPVTGDLN